MNHQKANKMKRIFLISFIFLVSFSAYSQNIITSDTTVTANLSSWRFSTQGGYAYRAGKVDQNQDVVLVNHIKKLKHGATYGADATWFFMESMGVGLKYNDLHVGNSEQVTVTYDDGTLNSGFLEDKISIRFFGPIASYRVLNRNMRDALYVNVGLGYMAYKDHVVLIEPFIIKGSTLGCLYEIGYDMGLTDKVSLGAMLSSVSGTLTSCRTNQGGSWNILELDSNSYESLNYINLSIGLRINL